MKKRTIAMFLSVALCLSVALTGCGADKSQQSNPSDDGKKSLTIAVLNDVVSLDPAVKDSGIEMQMASHLYDALVDYNADLSRKPGLAESWTVLDDGVTWEFKLRHGVKFSNGNDFNADDVVFSFERILNDPTLEMGVYLMRLQEVKKVDDYTVQLVTKIPYPVFDGSLVHIMMLDKETCEGLTSEEIAANPVGTGRYRLVEHVKESYASLNPRQKIMEILTDPMLFHKLCSSKAEAQEKAIHLLERVGLSSEQANRYPHQFSGGQRQRIGIARALAVEPKFIIADEPVSALDVSIQAQILNILMDLKDEFHFSYLFIAHDLSVVKHISDSLGVMYLGTIVERAPKRLLFSNPVHPYTKALFSSAPTIDEGSIAESQELRGEIPSPIHLPSGCPFHDRCPMACPDCAREVPELKEVEPGHFAACHLL